MLHLFSSLIHSKVWSQCGCATSYNFLTHSFLPVQFNPIHPIQGTWESHSRVSSLCSEVTLTWGQRTPRLCQNLLDKTSPKIELWQQKVCVQSFLPFMCCWPWLYLCQSLVWSSSADAHVASVQVKSAQEVRICQIYCSSTVLEQRNAWLNLVIKPRNGNGNAMHQRGLTRVTLLCEGVFIPWSLNHGFME